MGEPVLTDLGPVQGWGDFVPHALQTSQEPAGPQSLGSDF